MTKETEQYMIRIGLFLGLLIGAGAQFFHPLLAAGLICSMAGSLLWDMRNTA